MTREGWPAPDVLAQAIARINRPDWDDWDAQVHATGGCARPVRLAGHIDTADPDTGNLQRVYDTATAPDGVLLKACQSRRAIRCPACAVVYRADARNLVLAGLLGGKGTPDTVAGHPVVFATLTAPSYGRVHVVHQPPTPCHPHDGRFCAHGRALGCGQVHDIDDELVGGALCPDCYDYTGAVIFNARVNELWRRTIIAAHRALARLLALPVRHIDHHHRLAFIKVVEYQRRGVVHLHALLRLDPVAAHPPPEPAIVAAALRTAAARATVPDPRRRGQAIRWGEQIDAVPVAGEDRPAVAVYHAKYATKSTDPDGILDRRLANDNLDGLGLNEHLANMVHAAWALGGEKQLAGLHLRYWAHTLGYRGHWLTKSPNWSTTFAALRAARHHYQLARHGHQADEQRHGEWAYQGIGYQHPGDAWLAQNAAANRHIQRRTAWEERE